MHTEPKSKCCNAKINVEEEGVSQLSWNIKFTCSKCRKELDIKPLDFKPNW